jgi:hypothetical protein
MEMDAKIGATAKPSRRLYRLSRRATLAIAVLGLTALSAALYLRYGIIQNTPIGLACETGEESLLCTIRLAVILLFVRNVFGWVAIIAAAVQLWRPNSVALTVGLVSALLGLVLYNTRASALAASMLVLSFARPAPAKR